MSYKINTRAYTDLYISELLPQNDLAKVIAMTGCGLELLRFSVGMNLDQYDRTMNEVQKDLQKLGNPRLTVHGPFLDLNPASYEPLVQEAARYRFEQAYQAAETLCAKKIIYHSGWIPHVVYLQGWPERLADFWNRFLENKSGIQVCMENVFDQEIEPFATVAEKVEHPDFKLCLDIGHAHCWSEHTVTKWADTLAGRLGHIHVHDNHGLDDEHLALGDGTIPYESLFKQLKSNNENLTWTVENTDVRSALKTLKILLKDEGGGE